MNRIRQIINLDPESTMVNKEALLVISKATESFIQDLGGVCAQIAKTQKRKTLLLQDLLLAVDQIDRFNFIKGKLRLTFRSSKADQANTVIS